jgi:hypothetical protein
MLRQQTGSIETPMEDGVVDLQGGNKRRHAKTTLEKPSLLIKIEGNPSLSSAADLASTREVRTRRRVLTLFPMCLYYPL